MELGKYYNSNEKRLARVKAVEWNVALTKCEEHIRLKLRQRTLYGAHSSSVLGADPIDHYISLACEKIISGAWEWQEEMELTEQLIRIINSSISKSVEHVATDKATMFKVTYGDIEDEFYKLGNLDAQVDDRDEGRNDAEYERRLKLVEESVAGDIELEILWEGVKEGKKRTEIAALLDKTPRQFDKLREKLIRKAQSKQS